MFQKNSAQLVILIFAFGACNIAFGQGAKDNFGTKYQEYRYADEQIFISLKTNAYKICEKDSVELIISVQNNSSKSIFVFKEATIWYNTTSQIVVIEYGGMFTSNIERELVMREIKPKSSYIIKRKLNGGRIISARL